MNEEVLKGILSQAQKNIQEAKDMQVKYDMLVNAVLDNKDAIEQFYKSTKEYEHIQFYLTEITQPDLLNIKAKYKGTDIATITISKDKMQITTTTYDKSNKENFECNIQLKDEDLKSSRTQKFFQYFIGNIPNKTKGHNKTNIESMLLAEFSKTSSYDKLLTGIQTIRLKNVYLSLPIIAPAGAEIETINTLTRTKIRKITIFEMAEGNQEFDTILAQATLKAAVLINLLKSPNGDKWYKLFGFHGKKPNQITIKVCIAVDKKASSKYPEVKHIQIPDGIDTIDYRYLYYETDDDKITSIQTNVNE